MPFRNLKFSTIIFLLAVCFLFPEVRGFPLTDFSQHEKKKHQNKLEEQEELGRIIGLIDQAKHFQTEHNRPEKADSLLKIAIESAEMSYNNELIAVAYNGYLECVNEGVCEKDRSQYAAKAEMILKFVKSDTVNWRTCDNLADVYRSLYNFDKALEMSYKSLGFAESADDKQLKAKSYISIGKCLEGKNSYIEAFRNYLQALNFAENSDNPALLQRCYEALSRFYLLGKNFNKATEYKLKQAELMRKSIPVDSVGLMSVQIELESISYSNMNAVNETNIEKLLRFSARSERNSLRYLTLSLYRAYLIKTNQIDKLEVLYLKRFPQEFTELLSVEPSAYYRVIALIKENHGDIDSAAYYFREADQIIQSNPNKILQSNFYIRYGQFYKRQKKMQEAIGMFEKGLQLAEDASYLEYAITACDELEKTYAETSDYKKAHDYACLEMALKDSLSNISKKDILLNMEIENTAKLREDALAREQIEKARRYNLQYTAITIILALIFLFFILLGSIKVPHWAIHLLGFVSFIMVFEFIVLIADQWIHRITGGEPWKVLAIKIVLIGFLMPLHNWTERKVIHYLIHKRNIHITAESVRKFFREVFGQEETESKQ